MGDLATTRCGIVGDGKMLVHRGVHCVGRTFLNAASTHFPVALAACGGGPGVGAALVIGAIDGLYPSMRAAHLSPTEALRTV
jgi:ABC-type lipoprotein release transport system permease subunit